MLRHNIFRLHDKSNKWQILNSIAIQEQVGGVLGALDLSRRMLNVIIIASREDPVCSFYRIKYHNSEEPERCDFNSGQWYSIEKDWKTDLKRQHRNVMQSWTLVWNSYLHKQ